MPKTNANTLTVDALVLLIAYPLSLGPAARLQQSGLVPGKYLYSIYTPLAPFMEIPVFRSLMLDYLRLWGVDVDRRAE